MEYKGYVEVQLDDDKLTHFYTNKEVYAELYDLKENQYLLIKDSSGEVVDKYCRQGDDLRQVKYNIIQNTYCGKIKPRNLQQELAMDMLIDKQSKVKLGASSPSGLYDKGDGWGLVSQLFLKAVDGHGSCPV